ncbi:MAG: type III-A CRISPR-associated RAMP protein Csm4 [candidate division WOR-3 bacterium]
MKIYRIKLTAYSGFLTPFQADTVFGHLCWVVAHNEGEKKLKEFLQPFKEGNPPFIISDGLPTDLLPKPLSAEFYAEPDKRKDIKKIEFVTLDDFNKIRKGEEFEPSKAKTPLKYRTVPHSRINRLTWSTPTEAGLYSLEEFFVPYLSVYLKLFAETWHDRIVNLFNELSKIGYGRKKSIGQGQFEVTEVKEFNFGELKDANGFVTLSNFCPQAKDPTEGIYKTFVKYGKLGEEFTFCGNPFKRPLVMIKTGSVFKTNGHPKEFYGRMVENVAPVKPEVIQYGYAFALPIIYPKTE